MKGNGRCVPPAAILPGSETGVNPSDRRPRGRVLACRNLEAHEERFATKDTKGTKNSWNYHVVGRLRGIDLHRPGLTTKSRVVVSARPPGRVISGATFRGSNPKERSGRCRGSGEEELMRDPIDRRVSTSLETACAASSC
jgi:hypothetical protein